MNRVAAIDCGTNSIRLLISELDVATGTPRDVVRLMRTVRLGEGVDSTGEFSAAALDRTFAVCEQYAAVITDAGVSALRFVATSASRDVSNRAEFVEGVHARLGVTPDVISGMEEANLSFLGAVRGLPAPLIKEPVLVVDIGGGSTEFVLGSATPTHSVSVNVGCVRMTERHLFSDPPTAEEIARVEDDLAEALDVAAQAVPVALARTFVGVAGSVTTIAAMALNLPAYDPLVLHGAVISLGQVEEVTERLLAMTRADRAALPFMHPGRVDVIGGGAMVLRAIMRTFELPEVVTCETDILDGIAYRLQS